MSNYFTLIVFSFLFAFFYVNAGYCQSLDFSDQLKASQILSVDHFQDQYFIDQYQLSNKEVQALLEQDDHYYLSYSSHIYDMEFNRLFAIICGAGVGIGLITTTAYHLIISSIEKSIRSPWSAIIVSLPASLLAGCVGTSVVSGVVIGIANVFLQVIDSTIPTAKD